MTIINEAITPYTAGLDCGKNNFDGSAVAISLNRTRRRARREAARRTRTLRNLRWREIRQLKCPEFDCSRRKVTHVYAPAPLYFLQWRIFPGIWVVGVARSWQLTIECRYPES